jgi:parallel beta-helix repeat protein
MAIAESSRQEGRYKREVASNKGLEVSYDEETNTIIVQAGEEVTLPEISQALEQPDLLQELLAGEWLLAANLQINEGAAVEIAAPDVHWLKLRSDDELFVWIKARGGQLDFSETCVTSWDVAAQDYDQNGDESQGRSFVLARDGAQMNILDSELSYLGYQAGESYGVAWRLEGTSGKIEESTLAYNHYGLYTYEVSGLVIRGNEVHHSTKYGIDPHTNSNQLLIENNISHHNGKHGIILAEGCTDSIIRNNEAYQNTLHGIVLYEQSNNNTIEENRAYANGQQGININNSSSNIILNNSVFSNTLAGIGIGSNASDNLVTNNEAYDNLLDGIYIFSDATRNILQGNSIHHNARHGIYIKSSDNQLPSGNEVTRNQVGVYLNTDSPPTISLQRNSIYDNFEIDIRRRE